MGLLFLAVLWFWWWFLGFWDEGVSVLVTEEFFDCVEECWGYGDGEFCFDLGFDVVSASSGYGDHHCASAWVGLDDF